MTEVAAHDELIRAWTKFLATGPSWQDLIDGVTPKETDCGPVYELDMPIPRKDESFAICDMRRLDVSGAHYHTGGETEIYFVLEGRGTVYVGGIGRAVKPGSVVVTPPDTAHFTRSRKLVLGVVNTPPFSADNYRELSGSQPEVGFDLAAYEQVINKI
jgi:mannose-6-phosphate isomerase-like protein (cupin superfamily)